MAHIGVVAASYRNGIFVLVAPGYDATAATMLADTLRLAIARLALSNVEAIAADHVTASVAVTSSAATQDTDRIKLLTQAIKSILDLSERGGDEANAMRA
jgi:PleD family two-component response regulator